MSRPGVEFDRGGSPVSDHLLSITVVAVAFSRAFDVEIPEDPYRLAVDNHALAEGYDV